MSEYQYVAFRAVDRPLDDKQLAFAHNCAMKIAKAQPTLNMLKSSLRKRGLLD